MPDLTVLLVTRQPERIERLRLRDGTNATFEEILLQDHLVQEKCQHAYLDSGLINLTIDTTDLTPNHVALKISGYLNE